MVVMRLMLSMLSSEIVQQLKIRTHSSFESDWMELEEGELNSSMRRRAVVRGRMPSIDGIVECKLETCVGGVGCGCGW